MRTSPVQCVSSAHNIYFREPSEEEVDENAQMVAHGKKEKGRVMERRHDIRNAMLNRNVFRSLLAERKAYIKEYDIARWVIR